MTRQLSVWDDNSEVVHLYQDEHRVFIHHASIYSFIVLFPEMYREKYGSYWNRRVFLSGALFVVNVAMQLTLTHVTGMSILTDNLKFRQGLVNNIDLDNVWNLTFGTTPMPVEAEDLSEEHPVSCCRGSACRNSLRCCRSGEKPAFFNSSAASGTTDRQRAGESIAAFSDATSFLSRGISVSHGILNVTKGAAKQRKRLPVPRLERFLGRDFELSQNFVLKSGGAGRGSADSGGGFSNRDEDDVGELPDLRKTVCFDDGHMLDCTPPSFRFSRSWASLDFNGDGVWTQQEANDDEANLECSLADTGLRPKAVYRSVARSRDAFSTDVFQSGSSRAEELAADSEETIPISLDSFEAWRGLVVLCTAADSHRCGELLRKGVFDAAFTEKGENEGFRDLSKALRFCQEALRPGGQCESILPATYGIFRNRVSDNCGAGKFEPGRIVVNPEKDSDFMLTMKVDYIEVSLYERASTWTFRFFMLLILVVWFINMLGEIFAIWDLFVFCHFFPVADGDPFNRGDLVESVRASLNRVREGALFRRPQGQQANVEEDALPPPQPSTTRQPEGSEPAEALSDTEEGRPPPKETETPVTPRDDEGRILIHAISRPHKITCYLMVTIRTFVTINVAVVGSVFLLTTYSYTELLMNAVALAFVFELPVFLYALLVSEHDKALLNSIAPLKYTSNWRSTTRIGQIIGSEYFIGLAVFPSVCMLLVLWDQRQNINPVVEALQCVCHNRGPRCASTSFFKEDWWEGQWSRMWWIFK